MRAACLNVPDLVVLKLPGHFNPVFGRIPTAKDMFPSDALNFLGISVLKTLEQSLMQLEVVLCLFMIRIHHREKGKEGRA